ncbi:unnamed protein product [Rotaria sp. Silwood2]|nr:unnamed protein product [Rotaria sp. Silwood2]CAF2915872.1 unnamed protein product [Rotaria sp. Silwood2]CAF3254603.1 unnamed protein product [Rotaria sp. Silwood2]CAF3349867.1 unnamed protein product [Rotaria sp. Silwood2]CAF3935989.1 unnamed protein product [Rotaria sp. Silwood2]
MSNSTSQEITAAQCQFLTIPYNPAAHPRQISLLDTNGQQILYTLIESNQDSSVQVASQLQRNNITATSSATHISPNMNACCICNSHAVAKCSYGISSGRPCGRLLCLSHIYELPSANGGRYPHCPEHYQHIQQNKCHVM